jgi:thiamine-phosphate pyrophosphorylase
VQWLRIIDVNINRLDESLKQIEDITRFHLEDRLLLSQIRDIRVHFLQYKRSLPLTRIIGARRSQEDLGRKTGFDSLKMRTTTGLILSCLSRAKESARTIEEIIKTVDPSLSYQMKDIRFEIYDFEKNVMIVQTKRFDPSLEAIIDEQYLSLPSLETTIRTLATSGATMIQLRIKKMDDRRFLTIARRIRKALSKPRVKFIINNRIDIALACNADGVHLGQKDIPIPDIRKLAGEMFIIGASANNLREAKRAELQGADYLGVGAIYPTQTKRDARVCTLRNLRTICRRVKIPVIGIGGISDRNYKAVLRAGASGIAVASFLFEGNLKQRIRSLTRSQI